MQAGMEPEICERARCIRTDKLYEGFELIQGIGINDQQKINHEGHKGHEGGTVNFYPFAYFVSFVFEKQQIQKSPPLLRRTFI